MDETVTNSAAVFESLNLNPQLIINETLNIVDDLLQQAFDYFLREAATLLKIEGTDRFTELSKGVACIQNLVQLNLDQRLQKWEEYCLHFPFHVPDGFDLPKADEPSGDDLSILDSASDTQLEAELNSLCNKLSVVGKETAELASELHALERQSLSSNQYAGSIDEALQLYNKNDAIHMFQELTTISSEFREKVKNLKRRIVDETQHGRADRVRVTDGDVLSIHRRDGLFGAKLEELQDFLDGMPKSY